VRSVAGSWTLLVLVWSALPAAASPPVQTLEARVVDVADGDTVPVLDPNNIQHKIRSVGIDAPEKGQPTLSKPDQYVGRVGASMALHETC
jgi:endonuclease YncB( thermonuclease family)